VIPCGGNPLPGSFISVGNESLPVAKPIVITYSHRAHLLPAMNPRRTASDLSPTERWLTKRRCWLIKGAAAAVRRWNYELKSITVALRAVFAMSAADHRVRPMALAGYRFQITAVSTLEDNRSTRVRLNCISGTISRWLFETPIGSGGLPIAT
jgi:hypothetical protein